MLTPESVMTEDTPIRKSTTFQQNMGMGGEAYPAFRICRKLSDRGFRKECDKSQTREKLKLKQCRTNDFVRRASRELGTI
jgi:hypothetical protein